MKGVTEIFISKEKLSIFWFFVSVAAVVFTGWHLHGLSISSRGSILYVPTQDAYFSIDRNSLDPVPLTQQLSELVDYHTRLALETYLNRSPRGPLTPGRLKLLFSEKGYAAIQPEIESNAYDFKAQKARQIVELGEVNIRLDADGGASSVANGQLVRMTIDPVSGELVTGAVGIQARMSWIRNPNLKESRRCPYICDAIEMDYNVIRPEDDEASADGQPADEKR